MPGNTLIWLDGVRASALPLPDRGLDFGDGLFETFLVRGSQPLFSQLHLERLNRGCHALGFPDCDEMVRDQLQQACNDIGAMDWEWTGLRLTLTRGAGPRGYAPPEKPSPRLVITATSLGDTPSQMAAPATLGVASMRWPTQPALAGLKHLNRIEQVMAARESRAAGLDESIMLDQRGSVVSVVAGNLFLVVDGHLQTPALEQCGIAGTRRELIIGRWAAELGLAVREEDVSTRQLELADEIFYCNSLLGLRPVGRLGQHSWSNHSVCEALDHLYRSALA